MARLQDLRAFRFVQACLKRFVEVQGIDRGVALGAQAFTALLPLLVNNTNGRLQVVVILATSTLLRLGTPYLLLGRRLPKKGGCCPEPCWAGCS